VARIGGAAIGGKQVANASSAAKQAANVAMQAAREMEAVNQRLKQAQAAHQTANSAYQAVTTTVNELQKAARKDPGTVARWFHRSARQAHSTYKKAQHSLRFVTGQMQQAGQAAQNTASVVAETQLAATLQAATSSSAVVAETQAALAVSKTWTYFGSSMMALSMAITAYEIYCLSQSSRMSKEGMSYESSIPGSPEISQHLNENSSSSQYDMSILRGLRAVDDLIAIVQRDMPFWPPITVSQTIATLDCGENDGDLLALRRMTSLQRVELEECHSILRKMAREARNMSDHHAQIERYCSSILSIHTYWVELIWALLSGETFVLFPYSIFKKALWGIKFALLDHLTQPWALPMKMFFCGKAATQDFAASWHATQSYEVRQASFVNRVRVY